MELLQKIPSEVWAAITASLITLGGVFLSNRHARKQQISALEHDERERDKEREISLRREVFLEAAEAISNGLNALGRIINLDISDQDINPDAVKNGAAISKVYLVGTNQTVQAVSAYYSEYNSAYLELMLERLPLMERHNSVNNLSKLYEKTLSEGQQLIELMKNYNLEGKKDERKWQVISENYKFIEAKQNELSKQIDELNVIQQKERFLFTRLVIEKLSFISTLIPPAVFAVRHDLKLPLDEEAFLKIQSESLVKTKKAAEKFLSKIQQLIDTQSS